MTIVGFLSSVDADVDDTHQYALVEGEMSNDNDAFIISGDTLLTNSEIDYETKSTYWIRVQTDDGNGEIFSYPFIVSVIDVDETSVEEFNALPSFKVYPVPAVNEITVEIDNPENKELCLEIYNNAGTLLHSENTFTGTEIDLSSFSNGMYFLTIRGESILETRKIIVKD